MSAGRRRPAPAGRSGTPGSGTSGAPARQPRPLSPARAKAAAARRRGLRLKYITRLEQPERRTFGWQVRVLAEGRVGASGFFPDATYGTAKTGHARALAAAIAFRDAAERDLGLPGTDRVVRAVARSNTGVLGVHWSAQQHAYVATYPVAPRQYVREHFTPAKDTAKAHRAALAAATAARTAGVAAYHAR